MTLLILSLIHILTEENTVVSIQVQGKGFLPGVQRAQEVAPLIGAQPGAGLCRGNCKGGLGLEIWVTVAQGNQRAGVVQKGHES